jgi:hypothetical protein
MTRRLVVALVSTVIATSSLSGCRVSGLQMRVDDRLAFVSPEAGRRAQLPVTVRWSMRGFTPSGLDRGRAADRGAFAVFVDRTPMSVGADLRSLAGGDQACRRDPRCPDLGYLAERDVLVTTEPTITLARVPKADDGVGDEQHSITVVLVDGSGHRIGESAWYLPFTTRRVTL